MPLTYLCLTSGEVDVSVTRQTSSMHNPSMCRSLSVTSSPISSELISSLSGHFNSVFCLLCCQTFTHRQCPTDIFSLGCFQSSAVTPWTDNLGSGSGSLLGLVLSTIMDSVVRGLREFILRRKCLGGQLSGSRCLRGACAGFCLVNTQNLENLALYYCYSLFAYVHVSFLRWCYIY